MATTTTTTTTTSTGLNMKLLMDTKAQRVLFAEASKDVVDFLFSLLALPVGTAVKLLGKDSMVGCVGNLYGSVEKLDGTYVQPGAAKDALLHPVVLSPAASSNMLRLPEASAGGQSTGFFRCGYNYNHSYMTDTSGTKCPSCNTPMTLAMQFVAGGKAAVGVGGKGFVQGIVTYTVMDNLTVSPMSSISSIALLNTFAVKDIAALQEKTVQLGYNEVRVTTTWFFRLRSLIFDILSTPLLLNTLCMHCL
jgi:hypothetical protein